MGFLNFYIRLCKTRAEGARENCRRKDDYFFLVSKRGIDLSSHENYYEI